MFGLDNALRDCVDLNQTRLKLERGMMSELMQNIVCGWELVNLNSGSHSMSYTSNFPLLPLNESVKLTLSDSDNL